MVANQNLRPPSINISEKEYRQMSLKVTPKPDVVKNTIRAFWVGGLICAIGQVFVNLFLLVGLAHKEASTSATAVMIFLGAILTGLGIYDNIGKYGGAGSIIPVTGFSNSIVSPALEFKREGYIMGVGAKLFTVAGPVLVFGISASIFVGLIYYLLH